MDYSSAAEFEKAELDLLDKLCEQFRTKRNHRVHPDSFEKNFGVNDSDTAHRLFVRLKGIGALDEHVDRITPSVVAGGHRYYTISPKIFEITEQRRADIAALRQPVDRVAKAEKWLRSHWLLSIVVIVLLAAFFVTGLLDHIVHLIDWGNKTWGR